MRKQRSHGVHLKVESTHKLTQEKFARQCAKQWASRGPQKSSSTGARPKWAEQCDSDIFPTFTG